MTGIPSLTLQQLELLRVAKQHPGKTIQVSYEFPVTNNSKPLSEHPAFIQELIDAHLIEVQVRGTFLRTSEFQQRSWTIFCDDLDYPCQTDWELWRKGFIARHVGGKSPILAPGMRFEQFSRVWIRKIDLQSVQPTEL